MRRSVRHPISRISRNSSSSSSSSRIRVRVSLAVILGITTLIASTLANSSAVAQNSRTAHPAAVSVARLHYTGGGDWYWGSSALPNLLTFMRDNTNWAVDTIERRVAVSDEELFDNPFLFATGHGVMRFSESDRERLRSYLSAGGFLFINDSYGMAPSVSQELAALFPDRDLVELPFGHEIYHSYYDFPNGPPKIHEHDNHAARGWGILIDDRVAVFFLTESDVGDGWEDSQVHNDPPEKRRAAFQMGVNLLAYTLQSF